MSDASRPLGGIDPGLGFRGFVALMASLMAVNALGIDSMLVALPEIGRALNVASENQRQWIIATYVIGFGSAQLVWGPLADDHGRKRIVVVSMSLFAVLSALAAFAPTFHFMLAARLLQGVAASASRVLVVSIVRDCYSGRRMARVMSLSYVIFFAVPILAPSIGQLIVLATGSWRFIFLFLSSFGALVALVAALRLKETLHPEYQQPLSVRSVTRGVWRFLTIREAIGYTMAGALVFGALMGFINSVQQIFADIFDAPRLFPLIFAGIAATMGLASLLNARIVERLGSRRVGHSALIGMTVMGLLHLIVAATGHETLISFALLQAATMFCFGLTSSNFSAMAMEPVGDIAGTASSVQGFLSTCLGALFGLAVGQSFDGTTVPLAAGFTIAGGLSIPIVLWTERGRMFRPHMADPVPAQ